MNYTIAFLIQHPVCWCDPFIEVCTPFSIGRAPIQEFVYPPRRYAHTPQTVSLHTFLSNCKTTFSPLLFFTYSMLTASFTCQLPFSPSTPYCHPSLHIAKTFYTLGINIDSKAFKESGSPSDSEAMGLYWYSKALLQILLVYMLSTEQIFNWAFTSLGKLIFVPSPAAVKALPVTGHVLMFQ